MYNDNDEFYLAIKNRKLKQMKLSQLKKHKHLQEEELERELIPFSLGMVDRLGWK